MVIGDQLVVRSVGAGLCCGGESQCLGNEIEGWMRDVGTVRALLVLPWDRNILGMADDGEKT